MGHALSTISGIGMAVGPSLSYADQFISIVRKKDASGFSQDITGVLIIANITRVWYWLGARFETPLLVQSLLIIVTQFALLHVCLKYSPSRRRVEEEESLTGAGQEPEAEITEKKSTRPGNFWAWMSIGSYIEFAALLIVVHCVLYLALGSFGWYISALGVAALGLEATLPIPQLITNFKRKSTAGFRYSVLAAWAGGDLIKTIYFFVKDGNSIVFKSAAVFQLSVDVLLLIQTYLYREQTSRDLLRGEQDHFQGVVGDDEV